MNFRRIRKCQCVQLVTMGLVLGSLMVSWEELDHHVVSHIRSYTYRYLVNSYDFSSAFAVHRGRGSGMMSHPYLINHPDKCADTSGEGPVNILLLLFVKSAPENVERRQAIRDTWGNESFVRTELGASIRMLFALGIHPDVRREAAVQRALLEEDRTYGDLIQQDFMDTFHNLTTKLILQFHWGHQYCPRAQFFMSADDDIFIHMPNLVNYLHRQSGARDMWVGHVHIGAPPVRRKESKYHVPAALYPWPSYPDYTAGAGYVVSADVAAKIYQATLALDPSMYIDDVFMGMCAHLGGVSPQDHVFFAGEGKAPYHPCIYAHMITSHEHTTDVRSLWRVATDPTKSSGSRGPLDRLYCVAVRVMLLCQPHYQNTYPCIAAFS